VGPHPAVAAVRGCVRRGLADLQPGDLVLAACSGGADSLALAAALAFEAPRLGLRAGGVTIDHGLQPGSADRASQVVRLLRRLELDPAEQVPVTVRGGPGGGGPEAAARTARYTALDQLARRTGAAAVLLAHSQDDQAETVLLGLARGAGGRSLAGMPARRGRFRRPLLGLPRATLRDACLAEGLLPWDDPHNTDPAYARARVRHEALPALEAALGPGIAAALARTAAQLAADCDALDALAQAEAWRVEVAGLAEGSDQVRAVVQLEGLAEGGDQVRAVVQLEGLAELAPAIRTRLLHAAAQAAGCPAGALSAVHVAALDALVTDWHGQRGTDLPGGIRARRRYGKLLLCRGRPAAAAPPEPTKAEVAGGRE
jgi:tRNA(Ile)-lysidine synthase